MKIIIRDLIDRLKDCLDIKNDSDIAKMLNMAQNTLSGLIKRNSLQFETFEIIHKIIFENNLSTKWILYGIKDEVISSNSIINYQQELIKDIKTAKKPLILAGRGIKAGKTQADFDQFVETTKIPVITTLLGLDTISYSHQQRVGFIGSYGNRWANIAFGECDLLIVLGARLDIRQTGADTTFIANRKIYHIDCEFAEINNRVKGCKAVVSELNQFFVQFNDAILGTIFNFPYDWITYINELKEN